MPRMDEENADGEEKPVFSKLLLVADGKVGKSHFAGMAAEAGFNVLYFDGDVAHPTLKQLPVEARRKIYHIDCADTLGGGRRDARFYETIQAFTKEVTFRWNDTQGSIYSRAKSNPEDVIWEIRPAKMDETVVWVVDSWTGYCESVMGACGIQYSVDLEEGDVTKMRPVYQSSGLKATETLRTIRSARTHVIVLAHPDEFTHTTKPEGSKVGSVSEKELKIDWTKMVPKSTSKPGSLLMAKYFTDVGWMEPSASGKDRLIDFRIMEGRVSGGHFNDRKKVEEYSFANMVLNIGGRLPPPDAPVDHWLNITTAGEIANRTAPAAKVLDGTTKTPIQAGTNLSSLFKKPQPAG